MSDENRRTGTWRRPWICHHCGYATVSKVWQPRCTQCRRTVSAARHHNGTVIGAERE